MKVGMRGGYVLSLGMEKIEFQDGAVAAVFNGFGAEARAGLLSIRARIFKVARETQAVAPLEEALRWGQPAYLTSTGSTIRLGVPKTGGVAVYTHCQTSIMRDFREVFPALDFEGNRAVKFAPGEDLPLDKLEFLIRRALTYHL